MKKNCMVLMIIFLIIYLAQTCPYKNKQQNLLPQENFYQTIEILRNNNEEASQAVIGFYFWIYEDHFVNPQVIKQFQSPFLQTKAVEGNLILTLGDENYEKVIVYQKDENIILYGKVHVIWIDLVKNKLENISMSVLHSWRLFFFVINPIEANLIFQQGENYYEVYPIQIDFNIIRIQLGGLQIVLKQNHILFQINGINLDVYQGRLTKLEILSNFLFTSHTYTSLLHFCFLPQKYIKSFGVYNLDQFNCQKQRFKCEDCQDDACFSCYRNIYESILEQQTTFICSNDFFTTQIKLDENKYIMYYLKQEHTSLTLIEEEIKNTNFNCMFGYFEVYINDHHFCLEWYLKQQLFVSPFQTSKTIGCIECLLDQKNWYKEPICKSDFISINEDSKSAYKYYERKEIEYDAFIIDELSQLVHIVGVFLFCKPIKQDNCFQLKNQHLNQIIFVKCKTNLIQFDGGCMADDNNCLEYSKFECKQCKIGSYLLNGKCQQCLRECLTCTLNQENQSVICGTCIENYAILNNTCQKCGEFCIQCVSELDKSNNQSFLRCQRCLDDSSFFLSFDGINCLKNPISNCLYAFQALEDNISISTLDYQFERQYNISKIVTLCSRCYDHYNFVFPFKQCIKFDDDECIFGYQLISQQFQTQNSNDQQVAKDFFKCLVNNQTIANCPQIQNCKICDYQEFYSKFNCRKCNEGYYLNIFSNQCYFYDEDCIYSLQQNKQTQDFWRYDIQPFYYEFIEIPYNHPYTKYALSQNEKDYEVVCLNWRYNLEKDCTGNHGCSKCDNEDKEACADCIGDEYLTWTLENYQCNECPIRCNACKLRSYEEMVKLNPYFNINNSDEFIQSTQKCLRSYKETNYYDWEINQFIQCDKYKQGCKKIYVHRFELRCDFMIMSPRMINDNFVQQIVIQRNIFTVRLQNRELKKLFQSIRVQSHQHVIQQKLFWIKLTVKDYFLFCIYSQYHSDVELEINCLHEIIWNIEGNVYFKKFTKITINGLIFKIIQNYSKKQLIFQSLKQQQINFNNVKFQHQAENKDYFQMCFFNTTTINFINSTFYRLILPKDISLIKIFRINSNKTISFIQTHFISVQMIDSQILNIEQQDNDQIVLQNLEIDGFFFNSSFMVGESLNRYGSVNIQNITIKQSIIDNTQVFFLFSHFQYLYITNLTIFGVNFTNSNFISLAEQNFIQNLNISQCYLASEVYLIKSINNFHNKKTQFINLSIIENTYSIFSIFLSIKRDRSLFSECTLENITLKNNIMNEQNSQLNFMAPNNSLIFIESDIIQCNNLFVERGLGLNEFTFQNTESLILLQSYITSGSNYRNNGVYQNLECFLLNCKVRQNGITIFIYSAKYVLIQDLTVNEVQSLDSPIIYYLSESDAILIQEETIILSNINFFTNILIQTKLQSIAALVLIESVQKIKVIINESTFSKNILQVYPSYYSDNIALLFYINAQISKVHFISALFQKNLVLNSQASILYILSTEISIQNCTFNQNNIFLYEVLRQHLHWTFNREQKIYIENLQEIFKIQSASGNGQFKTEKVFLTNGLFSVGQGNKAISFYIQILNSGVILIQNCEFYSSQFFLYEGVQKGSIIYIDCSNSFNVSLSLEIISIKQIYSTQKGGFLCVEEVKGFIDILLDNIQLIDVFSIQGSIIFFHALNAIQKNQIINIRNVYYTSSQESYANFTIWYNYYSQHQQNIEKQNITLIQISDNRSLISILQASILRIKNLQIQGLYFEKVMELYNVNTVQLTNVLIYKSTFSDTCILIAPNQLNQAQIFIENTEIVDVLFACFIFNNSILELSYPDQINQKCFNDESLQQPISLNSFFTHGNKLDQIISSYITTNCSQLNSVNGLIHFQLLNQIHQLKFNNFKIKDVNCLACQNGLLQINFTQQSLQLKKQVINNIIIVHSLCGQRGCLNLLVSTDASNQNNNKLDLENAQFYINNYICQYNWAENGTCLYMEEAKIILTSCDFRNNNASSAGGAIYSKKSAQQSQLILQETLISDNVATIGGGVFMEEQHEMSFLKFDSIISQNKAEFFANDIFSLPVQLLIQISGISDERFEVQPMIQNQTHSLFVQKLKKLVLLHGFPTNYTLLPNGIPIADYEYFDWKKRIYIPFNLTFRILALSQTGVQIKNLKNSFCQISSRKYHNSADFSMSNFTNNFTNMKIIYFNELTQDYNLDNLIIYNREDLEVQETLEFQFWCNSIFVPIQNIHYPYNLITQHDQYYLRIQIQTYPCQLGEIRNETFQYCQICNQQEGFFSLKLNQRRCQLRNEISTSEVQPAFLKLRTGFWRPYFDTSLIGYCENSHSNCQGGWIEGDTSCFYGHIGALCEECDVYNVRGQGQYSKFFKYQCKKCEDSFRNNFSFVINLAWIFFLISVSTCGSLQSTKENLHMLKLRIMGFKVFLNKNFKVIFMKILINYLQVIGSISTFELNFLSYKESQINFSINFTQNLNSQLDCLLSQIANIEIHYIKMVWLMIFPFICLNLFFLLYGMIQSLGKNPLNISLITTALLNVYGYFYPTLTQQLIELLSYRSISGYNWISSNVAYRFDKETHYFWMSYFCIPSVTIISIFIPILLTRILYKHKKDLDSKSMRANFGYLYNEYQKNAYFWEVQKIFQKEFLFFTLVYFQENFVEKFIVMLLILLIYYEISLRIKPYQEYRLNKLDSMSTQICLASFALSIGIFSSQKDQIIYINGIYKVVLLFFNIHFLVYLILLILKEYLISYFSNFYYILDKHAINLTRHFPNLICLTKLKKYLDYKKNKQNKIKVLFSKLKSHLRKQAKEIMHSKKKY